MAEKKRNEFKNTFEGKIKIVNEYTPVKSAEKKPVFSDDES